MQRTPSTSGSGWVVGQMFLLLAVGTVAPWKRGDVSSTWRLLPALALIAYGTWVGVAGALALGKNLTPLPEPKAGAHLVTEGVYGRMRHPLYASMMSLGLGWSLAWGSGLGLVLSVILTAYLHAKAVCEEQLLIDRFPEYLAYASSVRRYLPFAKRG